MPAPGLLFAGTKKRQIKMHNIIDYKVAVVYNDYKNVVTSREVNIVVGDVNMRTITTRISSAFALGQIIQQSRLQRGFSQRDLADMLGISQKWVWEMEQGKPGLLMDRLFLILEKTGVTLSAEFEVKDVSKK